MELILKLKKTRQPSCAEASFGWQVEHHVYKLISLIINILRCSRPARVLQSCFGDGGSVGALAHPGRGDGSCYVAKKVFSYFAE
mgnify:CR=1 FL=1